MSNGFVPVFNGRHLRAALHPGAKDDGLLVVTFDFRRVTRKGFSDANFSSSFARQGHAQLSISCRVNDWFINSETEALERAVAPVAARFTRVQALGYSMGGYGAFRFARALGLTSVVAVSPQATIAPNVVPGDTRYTEEAKGFDPELGDLAPRGCASLAGIILVDPSIAIDLVHARLITRAFPLIRIVALPFAGHPASRVVRDSGQGWLLQREATAPVPEGAAIRAAHRQARRDSAHYWQNLARAARQHHPRWAAQAKARAETCAAQSEAARARARAEQEANTFRNAARRAQQRGLIQRGMA